MTRQIVRKMMPDEEAQLEGFLAQHPDTSMFLRSNLAAHGLSAPGAPATHPHATTYHVMLEDPEVTGVLARTAAGLLMVQAPDGVGVLSACLRGQTVDGMTVDGMTGDVAQAGDALAALGLAKASYRLHQHEPLCVRGIDGSARTTVALRSATQADCDSLKDGFFAYVQEACLEPDAARARQVVQAQAAHAPNRADLRLLEDAGGLRGMNDFNARLGQAVQIAGVFVAPEAPGQGLAGEMILAQLAEAWKTGARRAMLLANNDAALHAYARIVFDPVGQYRVALLNRPQEDMV